MGDGKTTRSRGKCAGSGPRTGLARVNGRTLTCSDAAPLADASFSAAAVSSSSSSIASWSSSLRLRSAEAPKRSCFIFAISNFRCATIASAPEARASNSRRAARSAMRAVRSASSAAFSASISFGSASVGSFTLGSDHTAPWSHTQNLRSMCRDRPQPASSGRQVRCGFLQSMPSSIYDSCAAVIETTPSVGVGHTKRPRSSRLA